MVQKLNKYKESHWEKTIKGSFLEISIDVLKDFENKNIFKSIVNIKYTKNKPYQKYFLQQ